MKKFILSAIALLFAVTTYSQNSFKAVITDADNKQPLPGATLLIKNTNIGAAADTAGQINLIGRVPDGKQILIFSYLGYQTRIDTLTFPLTTSMPLAITLRAKEDNEGNELDEVVVGATRSSRTIANTPTRVEVISGEELDEKGNMKPGDIRMILAESTGIQTQQTSATSGNSSIRIQGLDGRYTQIIRDGFPLYSGFSGGLGLLQIAPLDLKQVEVIKGSSSTLYGGGAIAGLVNLVSKTPANERQLNTMLNFTSAAGIDASAFYAEKFKKTGTTIYAAYNHGSAYDPAGIGLTAIPKFNRFTLNPKLFLYPNDKTDIILGLNTTVENRIGGDILYVQGKGNTGRSYFEQNKTGRYSSQASLTHRIDSSTSFIVKNSLSYFDRHINLPAYRFAGTQFSSFSEADFIHKNNTTEWITGLNYLTDNFDEEPADNTQLRNYSYTTVGAFVQNTWDAGKHITIESGLRADHHNRYGFFLLPRLSALFRFNDKLSSRLGGGLGYKAPTVFTEDAERIQFRNVLPIDIANTSAERSYGLNYDINYRTGLFDNEVSFSINQLFFYTYINNPILLTAQPNGSLQYLQPNGNLNTKGLETNIKLTYSNFKLFVGYTYADVKQNTMGTVSNYALVSRHRLNNVLMYEIEDKLKIGAEAYYFGRQNLNDGTIGRPYWTAGLMAEKIWPRFSLFINFENLTDTRQTKFGSIYTGDITNPVFKDIYAPVDGFIINGGLRLKL